MPPAHQPDAQRPDGALQPCAAACRTELFAASRRGRAAGVSAHTRPSSSLHPIPEISDITGNAAGMAPKVQHTGRDMRHAAWMVPIADDLPGVGRLGAVADRPAGCGSGPVSTHDQIGVTLSSGGAGAVVAHHARRIKAIAQNAQQLPTPHMSAREAVRGLVAGKLGHASRGGGNSADADHRETDRPDLDRDTNPIEPGHRSGTEGDPAAVIRRPCRGFVDLDRYADLGKRERGSRAADTASDHYRAHAYPTLRRRSYDAGLPQHLPRRASVATAR